MRILTATLCLTFAVLLFTAGEAWSLPKCPGNWLQNLFAWTNCVGTKDGGGGKYVGEFWQGLEHGKGVCTYYDGRVLEGVWDGDIFISRSKPVDFKYCRKGNGSVYSQVMSCVGNTEITKAEYDRLKNQKTDTVSSVDGPLEAKLEKLKRLLEKGLITEEAAAAKRVKFLEEL